MIVNMSKVKVEKRYVNDGRTALMFYLQALEMKHYITPMLHSQKAIDQLVAQLRGDVHWREKMAFWDIGYVIVGSGRDGLTVWHKSGGDLDNHYLTFPGEWLADAIEGLVVSEHYPEASFEFTPKQIAGAKKQFGPRARLMFMGEEVRQRYIDCVTGKTDLLTPKNAKELKDAIQGCVRIARNHSHGETNVVKIYHDPAPHSFYWDIRLHDGRCLMNGGIIAHPERSDGEIVGYRYSTHT